MGLEHPTPPYRTACVSEWMSEWVSEMSASGIQTGEFVQLEIDLLSNKLWFPYYSPHVSKFSCLRHNGHTASPFWCCDVPTTQINPQDCTDSPQTTTTYFVLDNAEVCHFSSHASDQNQVSHLSVLWAKGVLLMNWQIMNSPHSILQCAWRSVGVLHEEHVISKYVLANFIR